MKLFSHAYTSMMRWSRSEKAIWYLMIVAFTESSFFVIPPDVMLAPMSLASPHKAWRYATVTTFASVLGGCFGYMIGFAFFVFIKPWIIHFGYYSTYQLALHWFETWGFWVVFVAGFSPIPYKIFTIAAGVFGIHIIPFIIASIIGRGGRFFLVAGLMRWGGEKMEQSLLRYIEYIGWGTVLVLVIALGWYYGLR